MSLSKVDTEIDQEKYLRESTRYFRGIEKPLKYGPSIESLSDLIAALHHEFATNYVNIEMVNHIMLSYKSNPKEWQKFAKFDRYKYTRNLVDAGNGRFNLMILCWGEGHGSTIHDHSDSHCFMKMLKGDLMETRYSWPSEENEQQQLETISEDREYEHHDALEVLGQRTMGVNEVAYINGKLCNEINIPFTALQFIRYKFQIIWVYIEWRIPVIRILLYRCTCIVLPSRPVACSRKPPANDCSVTLHFGVNMAKRTNL